MTGEIVESLVLQDEKGLAQGGWWNSRDIQMLPHRLVALAEQALAPFTDYVEVDGRVHEVIHCLDVALGSYQLGEEINRCGITLPCLSDNAVCYGGLPPFLSGLFHDLSLGFKANRLSDVTPIGDIGEVIEGSVDLEDPQYNKDMIGYDLRGAILLRKLRKFFQNPSDPLDESTIVVATEDLLRGSDLPVRPEIFQFPPRFLLYKVLDAVWYHDGNYPIRGHAEADMLVGDRVSLFEEGKVPIEAVADGIRKLLTYTEIDPAWETRSHAVDYEYLRKIVDKKTKGPLFDGFLTTYEGTSVHDYVVNELASQGRSLRCINSPAFWRGVDKMPRVLEGVATNNVLYQEFREQIATLQGRYVEAEQLRPNTK